MTRGAGVWEPSKLVRPEADTLRYFIDVVSRCGDDGLVDAMDAAAIVDNAGLMQLSEDVWQVANDFSDEELVQLIRFFTLAEMQLEGWAGGKKSPVIYLVRILRQRGSFDTSLRRWIKANTDNRYLPYGSLL